jgi:iron complex outermembrane receptor protein
VINGLFPQNDFTGKQTQYFADAKVSGDLMTLPAGPLAFAVGLDVHEEKYTLTPSNNLLTGDIVGYGVSTADASRFFSAAFAELNVPLLKKLEAQLAGRIDKFPNFAAHISPKVGLRYEASDALLLRGTFETGFRAPSLLESARSTKVAYYGGLSDPTRCPQATALANDLTTYYQGVFANPNATAQQLALANGAFTRAGLVGQNECGATLTEIDTYNPDLKPETSNSFGVGIVLEPVKGFSTSVDYFNIKKKNQINLLGLQQILNGNVPAGTTISRAPAGTLDPTFLAHDPVFGGQSDFSRYGVTSGPVQYIKHGFQNLGNQETSGIDFNAKIKSRSLWIGKLDLDLNATYTASFKDDQVDPAFGNLAGHYGYPKWAANSTLSYSVASVTHSIRLNFLDATSLTQSPGDGFDLAGCASIGWTADQCRVASYTTFDYIFEYSGIKNVVINADLQNVFARKYPTDLRAVYFTSGTVPVYLQDAQGRMLKISAQYQF